MQFFTFFEFGYYELSALQNRKKHASQDVPVILLINLMNLWETEAYLGPSRTSMMQLFSGNIERL